jgi:hypothetical protein
MLYTIFTANCFNIHKYSFYKLHTWICSDILQYTTQIDMQGTRVASFHYILYITNVESVTSCTKLICNIHRFRIWIQKITIIVGLQYPTFYNFNCVFFSACGCILGIYFTPKCLAFTICNKTISFYIYNK